jgi:polygalacturonase
MSNVKLELHGATLRSNGAIDPGEPYTAPVMCQDDGHNHWHNALLWGENLTNVAIVGPGQLDGQGIDRNHQKLIALKSSRVLLFEGLDHVNTGHFAYLLTDCHDITMAKLTMRPSRDGVDLMECTNVNAHDLRITDGVDDAFALKNDCALGKPLPTDNVTVADSVLGSGCTALQIGSETWGDFRNISWSNIQVVRGGKSGIGIQSNDGATVSHMSYEHITMANTAFPIFINTTALLRGPAKQPGYVEDVHFHDITATNIIAGNNKNPQNTAIVVSGVPGRPHQDIVFEKVSVTFPGGGADSSDPPEGMTLTHASEYNPRFIQPVPAYGAFIRHARGIELREVNLGFAAPDARPAVVAKDVDGLRVEGFTAAKSSGPTLKVESINRLTIQRSPPLADVTAPASATAATY